MTKNVFQLSKKHSVADEGLLGDDLTFAAHEAYRLLRTNIMFSFTGDKPCRVIGMVSSIKGEGKTTSAINLAYVLAESGANVCLVEGDMRMPQIAKRLDVKAKHGLSEVLTGQTPAANAIVEKKFNKVSVNVIVSGTMPPNPSELLSSRAAANTFDELSQKFDYIIIDLPPIDVVSDAIVLSGIMDGVIVVVSEGFVSKKLLNNTMRQLSLSDIRIIGFMRTFVSSTGFNSYKSKYKGKYGYYKYGYGYDTAAEKASSTANGQKSTAKTTTNKTAKKK